MIDKQEFFEKYNLDNRDLAEAKLTWEELENIYESIVISNRDSVK